MSDKIIRQLLEGRLATWAAARNPVIRIAYQDRAFTPTSNETYLRCFVLPANTASDDLQGVHEQFVGVWQVSIVKPSGGGGGLGPALIIEDELRALFPNNQQMTSGAFSLFTRTPMSAAPAITDEANTIIAMSCRYRADTI